MGWFSDNDKALRDARRELDEQHDREARALRKGDKGATERNLKLQWKVVDASKDASKTARGFWG